jgi:hypothetical protein
MGTPYYPLWLDNLADDVTGEGAAWDGPLQGAETVRSVVVGARELYEHQEFRYAGLCGDYGFLEDYTVLYRRTAKRDRPVTRGRGSGWRAAHSRNPVAAA